MASNKIRLTFAFTPEQLKNINIIFYFISYNNWDFEEAKLSNSL